MISYTIIRSKRKTVVIYITKDATVEVRAPLRLSGTDIDKFVRAKEKWLTEHLAFQSERIAQKSAFTLDYGNIVTVMGKPYTITVREGNMVGYADENFYMPPGLDSEQIKYACVRIYKMVAKNELTRRVVDYAKRMDVVPANVKINSATTRWGSCSSRNSINFSWRLIMAEDDVIEYVVVHELAHIKEYNHSSKFWAVVEGVLPNYKACQKKLKELQAKLAKEDWE